MSTQPAQEMAVQPERPAKRKRSCLLTGCLGLVAAFLAVVLIGTWGQRGRYTPPANRERTKARDAAVAKLEAMTDWKDAEAASRLCDEAGPSIAGELRRKCARAFLDHARRSLRDKKVGVARKYLDASVTYGAPLEERGKVAKAVAAAEEKIERDAKILARQFYGQQLRQKFLDQNLDIKVTVSGRANERITLRFVLFNDVWANKFEKGTIMKELREWGFERLDLRDGYDYHIYYDLRQ